MDLVAEQYVAVQQASGSCGVLVVSGSTGAAAELRDALLCDSFDAGGDRVTGASRRFSTLTSG